ncbi:hypothetical protein J1786_23420 [Rahnella sp. L72c]|uniref:Uncharacterized protein n=1 Tax=Rahnella perminowiae TaxID=2816244 RepID=A0ABS6L7B1_9GAMM|nr:hypothetical protein [Rahnella perminowiae]MBU9837743.1 hypothetical protein [Rahnella perminowiae]
MFLEQKTCHASKVNQVELTLLSADKMKETLRDVREEMDRHHRFITAMPLVIKKASPEDRISAR